MKIAQGSRPDSGISTSSMADIAFLLIVFFMVTSVFSTTKGLELRLPKEENVDPDPEPAVFIHVMRDGIEVDCRPMERDQVLPYLAPKLLRNPNKPVVLYTDSEAAYRDMVTIYDALAQTRAATSPWSFEVRNVSVPTRSEIETYTGLFGMNPFEEACRE